MNFLNRNFPLYRDFRFWCIQTVNIGFLLYISILHANDVRAGILNSHFQSSGVFQVFTFVYLVTLFESAIRFGPKGTIATAGVVGTFIISNSTEWFEPESLALVLTKFAIIDLLAIAVSCVVLRDRNTQNLLLKLNDELKQNVSEKERYIKLAGEAQENERRRISRDLHDDSLQLLATVTSQINEALESEDSARIHSNMMRAKETIVLTSDTIRRYCEELRPLLLESMGLIPSVEWIGREFQKRSGISVLFVTNGTSERLEPGKEIHIFRVMQEAFNNIERHSQATHVDVIWEFEAGLLAITVKDNGIGMWNAEPTQTRPLGIQGMHERVELVGGKLSIASQPGFGTKIVLAVPIV